jgi:hypothetical protein
MPINDRYSVTEIIASLIVNVNAWGFNMIFIAMNRAGESEFRGNSDITLVIHEKKPIQRSWA